MKDVLTVTRVLLDCPLGALLIYCGQIYCGQDRESRGFWLSFTVKDDNTGRVSYSRLRAKNYLLWTLNRNDKKRYFIADNGDYEIATTFHSMEEFLVYLKRYGFAGTRLKNRTVETA